MVYNIFVAGRFRRNASNGVGFLPVCANDARARMKNNSLKIFLGKGKEMKRTSKMTMVVFMAAAGILGLCGSAWAEEFELVVNVVGNGIADPNGGTYESGTVVTIETWPEAGHWVKSWSGSDDDTSGERMNTVTMTADKVVTVEFAPAIIVNKPAGGDVWASGSTHEIGWSSYGAGAVDILLSVNSGSGWLNVASGVSDSGDYMWHLPNRLKSDQCLISVVPSAADGNVVCINSGVFEIQRYHGPASLPRRRGWRPKVMAKYGPEYGCVKWKFETEGPVTAGVTIGRKIDEQRRVYAACEDGKLYALDFDTGALLWSYDVGSALLGSAAEGHNRSVYVGSTDGKVYAIDKEGKLQWSHRTEEPVFSSPVVSAQGRIYVCSEDGTIYALRRNGSESWKFETNGFGALGGAIFATPQIAGDGTVYVAGLYDPNLYALNPEDGSVKWACNFEHTVEIPDDWGGEPQEVNLAGWPFAPPAIGPDGTIYLSPAFDTHLFAIEPETGSIEWSTNLWGLVLRYGPRPENTVIWYGAGEPPEYVEVDGQQREVRFVGAVPYSYCWSQPAVGPDGTIYVSFEDAYLRAVDPNGSKKWSTKLGELGAFTLTAGDDGLVYAASDDKKLYVVDPNGEEVARFEGDGWLSHPTIAPGSAIIVSDANNTVWAISQESCDGEEPVLDGPAEPNEPGLPMPSKATGSKIKQRRRITSMKVKRL